MSFLDNVLGGTGGSPAPKNLVVQIRIDGSNVSWEHISFSESQSSSSGSDSVSFDLIVRFTQIGSAPPVVRPAGPPTSTG